MLRCSIDHENGQTVVVLRHQPQEKKTWPFELVYMVKRADTLPPPPFWRTRYFAEEVMLRPDRRGIRLEDVATALAQPQHRVQQADGRFRHWWLNEGRQKWLRVVIEPDGETVHNAFWDRTFKP